MRCKSAWLLHWLTRPLSSWLLSPLRIRKRLASVLFNAVCGAPPCLVALRDCKRAPARQEAPCLPAAAATAIRVVCRRPVVGFAIRAVAAGAALLQPGLSPPASAAVLPERSPVASLVSARCGRICTGHTTAALRIPRSRRRRRPFQVRRNRRQTNCFLSNPTRHR